MLQHSTLACDVFVMLKHNLQNAKSAAFSMVLRQVPPRVCRRECRAEARSSRTRRSRGCRPPSPPRTRRSAPFVRQRPRSTDRSWRRRRRTSRRRPRERHRHRPPPPHAVEHSRMKPGIIAANRRTGHDRPDAAAGHRASISSRPNAERSTPTAMRGRPTSRSAAPRHIGPRPGPLGHRASPPARPVAPLSTAACRPARLRCSCTTGESAASNSACSARS